MVSVNFKMLWQPIQASQFCQRPIPVKINYHLMILIKIIHCNSNRLSNSRILLLLSNPLTINRGGKEISLRLLILIANRMMTAKRIIKFTNSSWKVYNLLKIQYQLFSILAINNNSIQLIIIRLLLIIVYRLKQLIN